MLDYIAIAAVPASVSFNRNGRAVQATRSPLGTITIADCRLRVADSSFIGAEPPLPIQPPNGPFPVFGYQWHHPKGPFTACLVIPFRKKFLARVSPLKITGNIRPDLPHGIIVDSGEIVIASVNSIRISAGLGDGYYPVIQSLNIGRLIQAVILDFCLWKTRNIRLLPGQTMDEFGIVFRTV